MPATRPCPTQRDVHGSIRAPDVDNRGADVPCRVDEHRDPVSIFADRLARLWRLSGALPEGHHLIGLEEELVKMASAVCREHLLKTLGGCGLLSSKGRLEVWIRRLVWAKASLLRNGGNPGDMPDQIGTAIDDLFRARS